MSNNNSDLEYDFSEEEIADEMEKFSDGDRSLNERMSASGAAATTFNASFKNKDTPINDVKEVKVVTFSAYSGDETFTNI
jgi:hypothetical protein